ncbi:hypothetical protein [Streptomyces albidoflavus]|uniref:hypothetical protein n=1 Tax=Streptomyces albidoflavus TaxID=1886 RepID=UPI0033B16E5F
MSDPDDDNTPTPVMTCEVSGTLHPHPWLSDIGLEEELYSLRVKRDQAYGSLCPCCR